MSDLLSETTISASAAGRMLPSRTGNKLSPKTVIRWIRTGVKTPAGVVRLEGMPVGSRWFTSREAIERFLKATTQAKVPDVAPVLTPRQREAKAAQTRAEVVRRLRELRAAR